ncbi:MAG: hypothetical protein AAF449_13955, partial [Myxococcota bacterium]
LQAELSDEHWLLIDGLFANPKRTKLMVLADGRGNTSPTARIPSTLTMPSYSISRRRLVQSGRENSCQYDLEALCLKSHLPLRLRRDGA